MRKLIIYDAISILLLLFMAGLFFFSLYHYLDAKKLSKTEPSAFLAEKMKKHKRRMILLPFVTLLLQYVLWASFSYGIGIRLFESVIFNVLIYAIPVFASILFFVFRFRYLSALKKKQEDPDSVSEEEMRKRRILKNLFLWIAIVLFAVMGGLMMLLLMAIIYM